MSVYYSDDLVTLYHGDCREVTAWLDADVLVTDPPYGIAAQLERGRGGSYGSSPWAYTQIAGDDTTAARDSALEAWGNKPALAFGSWKQPAPSATRATLVWDKGEASGMGDLAIPWKPNWEEIYVLGSGFVGKRDSGIIRAQVVTWASKGREHPNMKPVGLMQQLLDKCPPGTVADPFAGSGSTLVAAKQLGRRSIGVELDEQYCEIAAKRLAQDTLFGSAHV